MFFFYFAGLNNFLVLFIVAEERHIIFVHPAEQVTDPYVKMQLSVDCKTAFLLWFENHNSCYSIDTLTL
jgi:hypothetical protein